MDKIINHFGSVTKMSRVLGVSIGAVSKWKNEGLPPWRAVQIERLTDVKFKAEEITYLKGDGTHADR